MRQLPDITCMLQCIQSWLHMLHDRPSQDYGRRRAVYCMHSAPSRCSHHRLLHQDDSLCIIHLFAHSNSLGHSAQGWSSTLDGWVLVSTLLRTVTKNTVHLLYLLLTVLRRRYETTLQQRRRYHLALQMGLCPSLVVNLAAHPCVYQLKLYAACDSSESQRYRQNCSGSSVA